MIGNSLALLSAPAFAETKTAPSFSRQMEIAKDISANASFLQTLYNAIEVQHENPPHDYWRYLSDSKYGNNDLSIDEIRGYQYQREKDKAQLRLIKKCLSDAAADTFRNTRIAQLLLGLEEELETYITIAYWKNYETGKEKKSIFDGDYERIQSEEKYSKAYRKFIVAMSPRFNTRTLEAGLKLSLQYCNTRLNTRYVPNSGNLNVTLRSDELNSLLNTNIEFLMNLTQGEKMGTIRFYIKF